MTHSTSWDETLCKWCPWLKEQLNLIYWCIKLYFASIWPCLRALTHTNTIQYFDDLTKKKWMCATVGRWAALSQCVKQTYIDEKICIQLSQRRNQLFSSQPLFSQIPAQSRMFLLLISANKTNIFKSMIYIQEHDDYLYPSWPERLQNVKYCITSAQLKIHTLAQL